MKTTSISSIALVLTVLAASGCASSPVAPPSDGPTAGQVAVLAGTTAAGAVGGNAINKQWGGPVGAIVGLGGGLLLNKAMSDQSKGMYNEGYAQGARDKAVADQTKFWQDHTQSAAVPGNGNSSGEGSQISYNAGVVEGVHFGARTAASENLEEPTR